MHSMAATFSEAPPRPFKKRGGKSNSYLMSAQGEQKSPQRVFS